VLALPPVLAPLLPPPLPLAAAAIGCRCRPSQLASCSCRRPWLAPV
jgi:hypothetical protein